MVVFLLDSTFVLYTFSMKSSDNSVVIQMSLIVLTASTGYLPPAVSPESITQSVPSIIALATSVVSALVGLGFLIIESSI